MGEKICFAISKHQLYLSSKSGGDIKGELTLCTYIKEWSKVNENWQITYIFFQFKNYFYSELSKRTSEMTF